MLRLWRLDQIPWGIWWDEADNGLHALRILLDPGYEPVFVPSTNLPSAFLYLIAAAQGLVGDGVFAIRLAAAALGLVGVLAMYLLGRELGGPRLGLLAALLLAGSRWHLTFSRLGMHGIAAPAFELLGAFFLVRAVHRGHRRDYVYAGAALAAGLWFYAAFRLFPLVLVVYLLAAWRLGPRPSRRGLVWLVTVASVLLIPLALYALREPELFFARTAQVSVFSNGGLEALVGNVKAHLGMFHLRGDPNGRHNLAGAPMLPGIVGLLFLLGLAATLRRVRHDPEAWLLAAWTPIMLLPAILSLPFEAPQSLRAIGALPGPYLLAAISLEALARRWRYGWLAAPALAVLVGLGEAHTYFFRQMRSNAAWEAHSTAPTYIGHRVAGVAPGTEVYLSPIFVGQMTLRYLVPWLEHRPYEPALTLPLRKEAPTLFFLDPQDEAMLAALRAFYPSAPVNPFGSPWGGPPILYEVAVTAEEVAALQRQGGPPMGLLGTYEPLSGKPEEEPFQRVDPAIGFYWHHLPLSRPYRITWEGFLFAPHSGSYLFSLRAIDQARFELVDQGWELTDTAIDQGPAERGVWLPAGWHPVRLEFLDRTERTLVYLSWQPPGAQSFELVPPTALRPPP